MILKRDSFRMAQCVLVLSLLLLVQLQSSFESTDAPNVDDGGWGMDFNMEDEGMPTQNQLYLEDLQGKARQGKARQGKARQGKARQGKNFRFLCSKSHLLREYGEKTVRLSTANTHSYQKVDVRFEEFVRFLLTPQSEDALGSDTLYFFGDNNFTEWHSLFEEYKAPPYSLPYMSPAYSFGIAGPGTGVPFHWHGPGYSEVIYGRKCWFLYPPEQAPEFHPNHTSLSWVSLSYPNLELHQRPMECTIRPGEVLYFPDRWWHATLNLDTSVFISTFLG